MAKKKVTKKNKSQSSYSFNLAGQKFTTPIQWKPFSRALLKETPQKIKLGKWSVDLLACDSGNTQAETLVVLMGPLESPNIYKHLAEALIAEFKILFVALPGFGKNLDVNFKNAQWDLKSMGAFMSCLATHDDLQSFHLMGSSAASSIALHGSLELKEQVKSLCVTGLAHRPSKIWKLLLNEIRNRIDTQLLLECADAALLYLVSDESLSRKRTWGVFRNYFKNNLQALSAQQKQTISSVISAILQGDQLHNECEGETPLCPVLAFTGEFDHLTAPHEHAEFIDQCIKGYFATVEDADHLIQIEKPLVVAKFIHTFLTAVNQDEAILPEVKGVKTYPPQSYLEFDRRRDPRYVSKRPKIQIESQHVIVPDDWEDEVPSQLSARLRNVNFSGCLIEIHDERFQISSDAKDIKLKFIHAGLEMNVLAFEQVNRTLRCLFLHESYDNAMAFKELLEFGDKFIDADFEFDGLDDELMSRKTI